MYIRGVSDQIIGFGIVNQLDGSDYYGPVPTIYRTIGPGAEIPVTGTVRMSRPGHFVLTMSAADCDGREVTFKTEAPGAVSVEKTLLPFDSADVAATIGTRNDSGGVVYAGQPVALDGAAHGVLASALAGGRTAIGLASSDSFSLGAMSILTEGLLALADWTAATGGSTLAAGSRYYLSATAGQLATVPPSGATDRVQLVGIAVSANTLLIFPAGQLGLSSVAASGVYNDLSHKPGVETESAGLPGFLSHLVILGNGGRLSIVNPLAHLNRLELQFLAAAMLLGLKDLTGTPRMLLEVNEDDTTFPGCTLSLWDSTGTAVDAAYWVQDAAGMRQRGQYGTNASGDTISGGLVTAIGAGGGSSSGSYTPVVSSLFGATGATANPCQWMKVGDVVTVSGSVDITGPAAPDVVEFYLDLPVASTVSAEWNVGGGGGLLAGGAATRNAVVIQASPGAGLAHFALWCDVAGDHRVCFSFTYRVTA